MPPLASINRPGRGRLIGTVGTPTAGLGTVAEPPAPSSPRAKPAEPIPSGRPTLKVIFTRLPQTKKRLLREPFYFQASPLEAFRWSKDYSHQEFDTVAAGQFSRPAGKQLASLNFSSLFVDYDPSWAAYHYGTDIGAPPVDVMGWTEDLLDLLDSGTPFALTVGQVAMWGRWDVRRLPVTMRSLEVENRGGEMDTRYFDIQLTEWRQQTLAARRRGLPVTVTLHETGDKATWDMGGGEQTMKNPTLAKLARKLYGDDSRWRLIARHARNREVRGFSGRQDLLRAVKKHGHGKKGDRHLKLFVPEPPARASERDDAGGILGG